MIWKCYSRAGGNPEKSTNWIHALAARALNAQVEIHFAWPAVRLLVAGAAGATAFVARALDPAWRTLVF